MNRLITEADKFIKTIAWKCGLKIVQKAFAKNHRSKGNIKVQRFEPYYRAKGRRLGTVSVSFAWSTNPLLQSRLFWNIGLAIGQSCAINIQWRAVGISAFFFFFKIFGRSSFLFSLSCA